MKLSAALLLAPFVLLASAVPNPATADKVAAISEARIASPDALASVTGTVNANNVRYRRCASTSCEAVGQYQQGQTITIVCRLQGETINGWPYVSIKSPRFLMHKLIFLVS